MNERFLYVSDIFCPWCYGFAPVLHRLLERFGFPADVLCGNLVEEPTLASSMNSPRTLAFFERLQQTTGRRIGSGFFELLKSNAVMDSALSCRLLCALRRLAPGRSLEQLEAFQNAFYGGGMDVLSAEVQYRIAGAWGVDAADLEAAMKSKVVIRDAQREMADAEEALGDFVVYPTLFVRSGNGELHAAARGYASFEKVEAAVAQIVAGCGADAGGPLHACGLDGVCH